MVRRTYELERVRCIILPETNIINIRKKVLKLAMPAVVEQTLIMIVGVVSTIFVGSLGTAAISGVGFVNILINFILALFVALSTGTMVMVARLIGQHDLENTKNVVRQSTQIGVLLSIFISIIIYIFSFQILSLLFNGSETSVISEANTYLKIILISFPCALVNTIVNGSLRGSGDTKTPMKIAYFVNFINIILSIFLIFNFNIFNINIGMGLGVKGAAISVGIARSLGCIITLYIISFKKTVIQVNVFKIVSFDLDLIKRMLKIGIPAAIEQILMNGGFLIMQVVISGFGVIALAVYQIANSINSIVYCPVWGYGMAATAIVGQSLGLKKRKLAEAAGIETILQSLILSTIIAVLIFVFARPLVSIYSNDPDVISTGVIAIRIFSFSQPFLAVVVAISGALRGAGDIIYTMITSFIGVWCFRIALTIVLNATLHIGIIGVFIAFTFDFVVRAILYIIRFRKGKWKYINV